MQLASRFASRSPSLRSDYPLSDDQIRKVAPSIFADAPHESRSERYAYIPTAAVLAELRKEGFEPFMAAQTRVRHDDRRDYTKLDWEIWTATLADKPEDWNALLAPIGKWINEGPTRVPLTDWYDTKTGKQEGFQARSVVGGVYIKVLSDKNLAEKWRNHTER